MTSFRRIEAYIDGLPREASLCLPTNITADWPTRGVVNVQNLSVAYSLDDDEVLKDISFTD